MSTADFARLNQIRVEQGLEAMLEELGHMLREQKQYHKLFDLRLVKKKHALGLPVSRPTSLDGLTGDTRKAVEMEYIEAAREVGQLFLEERDIPSAWMYFQVIREKAPVAAALEQLPAKLEPGQSSDQLIHIALFQQVHPERGVEWLLHSQGTCSTITTLDQLLQQFAADDRNRCAKAMVRHLYTELIGNVRRDVEKRIALLPPTDSLRELLLGREWLLENGNYHIDVSHLNAVVRFARQLHPQDTELRLALQLTEYGSQLDPRLQYAGEAPFEEFYLAHAYFFRVLLDEDREAGLNYFRARLEHEPDEQDQPLLAYVLVDLLSRVDRLDEAVALASKYLVRIGEEGLSAVAELCEEAGRHDALADVAQQQNNLVLWAASCCMEERSS